MIGVLLIATGGDKYTKYVRPLTDSIRRFFPKETEIILFTDEHRPHSDRHGADICVPTPALGWPKATLMRYHHFMAAEPLLRNYDFLLYMDCDMKVVAPVAEEELFVYGLVATLHCGVESNFNPRGKRGTYESRHASAARPQVTPQYYFHGCIQGGSTGAFLGMCRQLVINIDADLSRNIIAVWHDESHLNAYLAKNPPAKVLSPAYSYPPNPIHHKHPEVWKTPGFVPKILHIEKNNAECHKETA